MNTTNQWGVLSLKTVYREKEAAMVPAPVLTRERERERKRKSNFDAGKNHATTIIVGTPVAAIEPVLGDAGDDAIASV